MSIVPTTILLVLLMHLNTIVSQHVTIYLELAFLKISIASYILLVSILPLSTDKEKTYRLINARLLEFRHQLQRRQMYYLTTE